VLQLSATNASTLPRTHEIHLCFIALPLCRGRNKRTRQRVFNIICDLAAAIKYCSIQDPVVWLPLPDVSQRARIRIKISPRLYYTRTDEHHFIFLFRFLCNELQNILATTDNTFWPQSSVCSSYNSHRQSQPSVHSSHSLQHTLFTNFREFCSQPSAYSVLRFQCILVTNVRILWSIFDKFWSQSSIYYCHNLHYIVITTVCILYIVVKPSLHSEHNNQ
jgi:hypothetical protein